MCSSPKVVAFLNATGNNRAERLEQKLLSNVDALEKVFKSLLTAPRRLLVAAKNSSILKRALALFGLLKIAGVVFAFLERNSRVKHDDIPIYFLGEKLFTPNQWHARSVEISAGGARESKPIETFELPKQDEPYAAILVSLYKSEEYLDSFARNVLSQTIISECELIIICVQSSVVERQKLKSYFDDKPYVKMIFVEDRIGIYDAWNMGISASDAPFITNMNADDLRHPESLKIQVSDLLRAGADVVYQDVYYTLKHGLSWNEIETIGMRSSLPAVDTKTLASGINCPHNAPMWRRELHETIGLFDTTFKSAGDHDFWIRASIAGAKFAKSSSVHVSYFINPEGMSTKTDSPGKREGLAILEKYRSYVK